MVLYSLLGGGEAKHKMEFIEAEAVRGVSIIFFNF